MKRVLVVIAAIAVFGLSGQSLLTAVPQKFVLRVNAGDPASYTDKAGNVGAGADASFGVNILLPFEQAPNPVIGDDPKLITFKYFFTRKLFFGRYADRQRNFHQVFLALARGHQPAVAHVEFGRGGPHRDAARELAKKVVALTGPRYNDIAPVAEFGNLRRGQGVVARCREGRRQAGEEAPAAVRHLVAGLLVPTKVFAARWIQQQIRLLESVLWWYLGPTLVGTNLCVFGLIGFHAIMFRPLMD